MLWSLANGVEDMPESPPPGLVTIPNLAAVPRGHYTLAGYHPAGARAIRIDMLERLADLLRAKDSRAGFEATPDMLSITGMTLEQFAGLMEGLGYRGVRAERAKVKAEAVVAVAPVAVEADPAPAADVEPVAEDAAEVPAEPVAEAAPEVPAETTPEPVPEAVAGIAADAPAAEIEVFYTFTWAPRARVHPDRTANRPPRPAGAEGASDRPRNSRPPRQGQRPPSDRRDAGTASAEAAAPVPEGEARPDARPDPRPDTPRGDRPRHKPSGKPQGERHEGKQGDRPGGKPQGERGDRGDHKGGKPAYPKPAYPKDDRPKTYEARPPRVEKPIDPDNPFAVLAALKGRV